MIDTSIAAAYAAQYARRSETEPRVDYYCPNIGESYTYVLLDDLSPWLPDNDEMKTKIKSYGWELRVYDEKPSRLYAVPDHTPGGTRLVNKIDYCRFIDFKDSRKSNEVNFRNVAIAAKELVRRCDTCTKFIEDIGKTFAEKLPKSSLADYVTFKVKNRTDWLDGVITKYGYNKVNVDTDQVIRAIKVMDNLGHLTPVGKPFVKVGPNIARHWVENVLRMCKEVDNEYLMTDSFGVAAAIYMEDHFSSDLLEKGLQLPQIFETMEYFDEN